MKIRLSDRHIALILLLLILSIYSYNLDEAPLYMEEPRRAIVALEMDLNDNYIVPEIGGEYYYHKPPFFNWVLLGAFKISGGYSEAAARMVSVVSFIMMGVLTFFIVRRYVNQNTGIAAALLTVVSGDMLFYFSTMGGIDLFYSLVSYASMLLIYYYYEKKQYTLLFIITYGLAGIGFLTKGFPSVVFMGFSIIPFLIWQKDFKKLLSFYHLAGILVFLTIVAGYFGIYSTYNNIFNFFEGLWGQSYERTLFEHDIIYIVKNLSAFPFDFLLAALPASVLIIYVFKNEVKHKIKENPFIFFCFLIFVANIWIYWISPGTRTRYIYMLIPFFIIQLVYLFFNTEQKKWQYHFMKGFTGFIIILSAIAAVATIFLPQLNELITGYEWKVIVASGLLLLTFYLFIYYNRLYSNNKVSWNRMQMATIYAIGFTLILLRFIFASTVLPARGEKGNSVKRYNNAKEIYAKTQNKPLHLYKKTGPHLTMHFYLEKWRNKVVDHSDSLKKGHYYLASPKYFDKEKMKKIQNFEDVDYPVILAKPKHSFE